MVPAPKIWEIMERIKCILIMALVSIAFSACTTMQPISLDITDQNSANQFSPGDHLGSTTKTDDTYLRVVSTVTNSTVSEEHIVNSVNIIVGIKDLESKDWPPYGEQGELGIEFVLRKEKYPFAIVFEYLSASAEFDYFGTEKSSSEEINVGLRYEVKNFNGIMPYLEAGLTYAKGEVELQGFDFNPNDTFNESSYGAWFSVGNTWFRYRNEELGFKIKKTVARADLPSGRKVDLGGIHFIFSMGFHY